MQDINQTPFQKAPQNNTSNQSSNNQPRGSFYDEKQTYLLTEILETQKEILKTEKSRLNTSRLKFVTLTIKFLIIIWFMWAGFSQMKDFTENLFEKFMNPQNMISQLSGGNNKDSVNNLIDNSGNLDINSALNSLTGLLGK